MGNSNSDVVEAVGATTEAHGRLKPFVGTFKAEVTMWTGSGNPIVMTGTMVNELDLGDRYLRQTYAGDPSEGPVPRFEGRGFWGYNTITNQYETFWIDTASTMMQTDVGHVDATGHVWTMLGQMPNPATGETMTRRTVITLVGTNVYRMETYVDTGAGESKAMEIAYRRDVLRAERLTTGAYLS